MSPSVRIEDTILVPAEVGELDSFRRWMCSIDFPQSGRIDYIEGTIEVDMSPQELQTHGVPKAKLCAWILGVVESRDLGQVFVDRTRLTCPPVGLSCEPDVLFVSAESLINGKVIYKEGPDRFIEVEGQAALVVEVVSDSSAGKDTKRLPPLYAAAGIPELWTVDARGKNLSFTIHHLVDRQYTAAAVEANGFQHSRVLDRQVRLRREPWILPGTWKYFVDEA